MKKNPEEKLSSFSGAAAIHKLTNYRPITEKLESSKNLARWAFIRRGIRSDAQLSCTETRFQKCSQSGKNASKHPMLTISIAHNVISCKKNRKKHSKNQNCWFYNINSAPELRNDRESPKKMGSLNRDLLNFFYRYGIFWMPPGESSHPGGSECV